MKQILDQITGNNVEQILTNDGLSSNKEKSSRDVKPKCLNSENLSPCNDSNELNTIIKDIKTKGKRKNKKNNSKINFTDPKWSVD